MSATQHLFQQAQLAEAAYANLTTAIRNQDALLAALNVANKETFGGSFSLAQATAFVAEWEVIDQIPDTAAGFSATIFKNKNTGAFSLAIRGSTDEFDFSADAALIAVDGIAVHQLVDLYNFWSRSTTAERQTYAIAQVALYDSFGNLPPDAIPVGSSPYGIVLGNSSQLPDAALRLATGAVPSGLGAINVTGHSLGGHLAMAFTRLFPSITSSASVVNALGFKIGNSTVDSLFSILGGAPTFNAASILNVYGFAGPEFAVMNNGVLQQPGGFEGIFIENGGLSTIGGHSSVQMTDSAAVYDLFFRLSSQIHNAEPASALATLKSLFEAASSQADASLERIVDSLVNLFQLDFPPLTGSLTNNRDELYKRIVPLQAITKNLSDNNPGMHVDVLATSSATAASLALLASGSTALAYRYALKELNPFAIVGDNALYSLHNKSGELELYDPISGSGTLTEMWIKDRAEFFVSQNKSAMVDGEISLRHPTRESLQYIDKNSRAADGESDLTVNIVGTSRLGLSNPYKIVFGSDGDDVIEGGNLLIGDRLYGEEGDDFLVGGGGNDYLEGGRGFDIYAWDDADGVDSILDVDGQGALLHNGVAVSGGNGYGYGKYRSDDGFFEFLKQDGRLYVNGSVIVEDFENGDLGILLNDQLIAYAPPENLITVSKDKSVGTVGDDYFLAGQLQTNPDGLPGGPLLGEVFNSLSGSDIVESTDNVGEFRVVFGGSGDDELHAIAAPYRRSSYLIGEGGRDFIVGDIADDVIYGDGISGLGYLVPAYSAGELVGFSINYSTLFPHLPSYHRHEHVSTEYDFNADTLKSFIEGDPGNITNEIIVNVGGWQGAMGFLGLGNELGDQSNSDFLFGGDGNDVLYGGAGEDVVEGGAGNDRLYGGHGYSRWGAISGTESDPYFSATWTDSGSDTLLGDAGDDYLVDADDNAVINILDGGGGDDVLVASHQISDFFNDIEDILADSLPTPFSSLQGGDGSDFLVVRGTGSFVLDGGAGADTYWVFDATQTVVLEKQPDLGEDTLLISNFSQPLIPELSYQAITTLDEYRSNPFFSPSKFTNFPGPGMPPDFPGQLFQRVNDDLLIQFGGSIYVKDWFVGSTNKLQAIVFGSEVSFDDQVTTGQLDLFDVEWSAMGGISIDASVIDAVINDSPNLIVSEPGDVEVAGGQSADYLYGSAGNNFIAGGDGDDLLDGGAGNDILLGEMGHDELYGGLGIDLLSGGLDGDFLVGELGRGVLDGGDSQDIISLLGGEYFVIGGLGNDILNVNSPGSILAFNPGDGNDFITVSSDFILSIGGLIAPADLTLSDLGEDILLEVGEAESLLFSRQYDPEGNPLPWKNITLQFFGSAHLYDFNGAIEALYNQADDRLALGDVLHALEFEASEFSGLGGVLANAYQLHGNLDTLTDEEIRAVLASPDFGLSLQPLNLGETLIGTADTDELTGGPGNDLLDGREGADILRGSAGNDHYVVDQADDVVIELVAEGRDAVSSSVTNTLSANVEVLTLTGESDINGTGNTLDNEIFGNAGANRLDGKAGGDVLRGGLGNDTYVVDNINDFVDEQDESDVDAVVSSIDYILSTHLENLTLSGTALNGSGNAAANRLTGNARDNLLQGLGGNDVLNGGTGADTLIGGTGDDSYLVDNDADHVIELAAEGMDTVQSSVRHTLADHVENLTLTGTAANQGSGNTLDNRLTGNAADNVLEGFAGNDTLDGKVGADQMAGGLGDDAYVVDQAGDNLIEVAGEGSDSVSSALSWTLGDHFEQLTLTGSALLDGTGNSLDNQLTGNNAANTLSGLDGDDVLDGKGGADLLIGGAGNDSYVVAQSGDVTLETVDGGIDTVRSSITWTLGENLEHLVLSGASNIRGYGNTLANTLSGNAGNNLLDGGLGADAMAGGTGNDTYYVDDTGDLIAELAEQGVDTVRSSASRSLEANVENLVLTGTAAISGTGNALNNVLSGNAAANTLSGGDGNDIINGGAGADTLIGGDGNDLYTVDNVGDVVIEQAGGGNDTVQSSLNHTLGPEVENLVLTGAGNRSGTGNALDNVLSGNRGANALNGLAGNDTLAGGAGNDSYRFDPGFGRDVIAENDATTGNIDRIVFGAGVAATEIRLARLDDDLVMETTDRQNSIQVLDWFAGAAHQIERIEFSGGMAWDLAAIESQAMQLVDMPGLLRGDNDASELLGQIGNTLIEGQGGADILTDGEGNNLFSGGAGDDIATGGDGNDLFIGGNGNDSLYTGDGHNIVAFNAGGGVDTVYSGGDAENTLSLGGGLRYSDLSLSRSDNDLVLNAGADDKVVFKDWYVGNSSLLNLQVILDATDAFDASAADPLYNRRVQNFDFLGMVSAFDAAQAVNPGLSQWALGDALTQFHLSGADDAALGGDLAYWYARNGGFTGIGVASAQQIIGAPGFGAEAQGLREFSGLQEGMVRLS